MVRGWGEARRVASRGHARLARLARAGCHCACSAQQREGAAAHGTWHDARALATSGQSIVDTSKVGAAAAALDGTPAAGHLVAAAAEAYHRDGMSRAEAQAAAAMEAGGEWREGACRCSRHAVEVAAHRPPRCRLCACSILGAPLFRPRAVRTPKTPAVLEAMRIIELFETDCLP